VEGWGAFGMLRVHREEAEERSAWLKDKVQAV